MGLGDKIGIAGEEAAGKVKEAAGKATGDESPEAPGGLAFDHSAD